MIDKHYQGKGYDKNALNQVINIVKEDKNYNKLYLSFEPENHGAKTMYEKMGFKPTGDVIYGELVYVLEYDN
jgi:diamine N-acetyltransferase